jgi:hypothetical protein
VRAVRYENTNPTEAQGKFLQMYEIETDDLAQTLAQFSENVDSKTAQGRMSDLVIAGALPADNAAHARQTVATLTAGAAARSRLTGSSL